MSHQVLVESMDCERAHIGLYASRDVSTLLHMTISSRVESDSIYDAWEYAHVNIFLIWYLIGVGRGDPKKHEMWEVII